MVLGLNYSLHILFQGLSLFLETFCWRLSAYWHVCQPERPGQFDHHGLMVTFHNGVVGRDSSTAFQSGKLVLRTGKVASSWQSRQFVWTSVEIKWASQSIEYLCQEKEKLMLKWLWGWVLLSLGFDIYSQECWPNFKSSNRDDFEFGMW